LDELGF